ncbi:hypothetical protein Sden_2633 [Shewanella denitrificans OS217]|uniref:Uncharacterized protein n=1 Tax=Shewanella denitrificans (strain OS217 / ATCC BAA-1090 / DSM 15013) TaxID=318161 RepID=Q12KW4_SHEDO|nr:hypothetical protein Sden_2633 [Shewanella denitrificans OS217]
MVRRLVLLVCFIGFVNKLLSIEITPIFASNKYDLLQQTRNREFISVFFHSPRTEINNCGLLSIVSEHKEHFAPCSSRLQKRINHVLC